MFYLGFGRIYVKKLGFTWVLEGFNLKTKYYLGLERFKLKSWVLPRFWKDLN